MKTYKVTGKTFEYKNKLRAAGGRWNAADKCWVLNADRSDSIFRYEGALIFTEVLNAETKAKNFDNLYNEKEVKMMNLDTYSTVNQVHPSGVTDKYTFVSTRDVIKVFESRGWFPAGVVETKSKKEAGYQKHMVRLRNQQICIKDDDKLLPEIILINSHNGRSSFQIEAGIFRMVCSNGLIVADSMFGKHSIKHMGYKDSDISTAINDIVDTVPSIADKISDMKLIDLTPNEQNIYATAAAYLRYEDIKESGINTATLLTTRRSEDRNTDLFTIYNKVQENMLQGVRKGRRRGKSIRRITNIDANVKLNKGLWMLTEKMMELKNS